MKFGSAAWAVSTGSYGPPTPVAATRSGDEVALLRDRLDRGDVRLHRLDFALHARDVGWAGRGAGNRELRRGEHGPEEQGDSGGNREELDARGNPEATQRFAVMKENIA